VRENGGLDVATVAALPDRAVQRIALPDLGDPFVPPSASKIGVSPDRQ